VAVRSIAWLDVACGIIENILVPELLRICEPRLILIGKKLGKLVGTCNVIALEQRDKISKGLLGRLGREIKHN